MDAAGLEAVDGFEQLAQRASQTVEPGDARAVASDGFGIPCAPLRGLNCLFNHPFIVGSLRIRNIVLGTRQWLDLNRAGTLGGSVAKIGLSR